MCYVIFLNMIAFSDKKAVILNKRVAILKKMVHVTFVKIKFIQFYQFPLEYLTLKKCKIG